MFFPDTVYNDEISRNIYSNVWDDEDSTVMKWSKCPLTWLSQYHTVTESWQSLHP